MARGSLAAIGAALSALAGCVETTTTGPETGGLPDPSQAACMAAVAERSGDGYVAVLGTEPRRGGSTVTVGVGEAAVPWRCLAASDGSVEAVAPAPVVSPAPAA